MYYYEIIEGYEESFYISSDVLYTKESLNLIIEKALEHKITKSMECLEKILNGKYGFSSVKPVVQIGIGYDEFGNTKRRFERQDEEKQQQATHQRRSESLELLEKHFPRKIGKEKT